ncbi:MAG TPA: sigma 54-interacting transcriptional regulator [Myxococcales bacterium]|nr:sigma 54-interacting transcriptional regulator [Myxococcales bacterium]
MVHGQASTAFPLRRDGSVTIGRAPSSDVRIDDPSVSRQHARVATAGGRARVLDLDSHNGVRLNGHRIAGWHPLHGGDVIALGNATLVLALAREAAAGAGPTPVGRGEPSSYRLEIGDRWVLVADSSTRANYDLLRRLARSDISVLIHGETGVGKENAARAVHFWSARRTKPFLALNCSTLSETLAESVLFGHAKGAFTDAKAARAGLFESASGGTVFLDEVGELPRALQPKLLRVLEEKSVVRVGESAEIQVDVRIVAATNRNLDEQVDAGHFRKDLLFRLNAGKVTLAPLRDRRRELPLLARAFLAEECANLGCAPFELSAAAMGALSSHPWPGNVRELMNAMKFAAAAATPGPVVDACHLPPDIRGDVQDPPPPAARPRGAPAFRPLRAEIQELERTRMVEALEAAGGVQAHAAQLIGMPVRTFMSKLKLYQLGRPR